MRLRNIPGAKDAITESPYVVQNPAECKGKWEQVFTQEQPIHIEVGMGKGRFLMDMAKLHPEINYIGIEMYDSVLLRALQKREKLEEAGEKLDNLKFMCVDARLLPEIFEKGEIQRIYLNFSDPWPKKRYAKRRLSSATFLDQYKRILSFNGEIQMKTDNSALFEYSLIEFQNAGFKMVEISVDYRREKHDEDAITEYEQKFISLGQPIYRCVWRYAHD